MRGSKASEWGDPGRGCPPPSAEKFLHMEPEKTVSDAYFGQRLLEYDFLQMARGKTIISSVKHAVSDTLIIIISERAPLEMTYISMSPKVICEGAKRLSGGGSGREKHLESENTVLMHIWGKDEYAFLQIARGKTI